MFFILLLLLSLRQTYALSSFGLFLVRYKLDCFVEPLKTGERLDFHYEVMSSTGSTAGGKDSDLLIGFHVNPTWNADIGGVRINRDAID